MKIFIIYAPVYTRCSAGIYALYKLAYDIKQNGHTAFITLWNSNGITNPVLDIPVIPNISAQHIVQTYDAIVVYPETIPGNPLNASRIIRWVMNKPGAFGVGDIEFAQNEKIFVYGSSFNDSLSPNNIITGELTTPTIDTNLFKFDPSIQKTDITVYTGKQKYRNGFIDHYDNIITRTSPSREEIAAILKRTKILYSFDCVTNIVNEARLCGCEVVYIPNDEQRISIEMNEFGSYGLHLFGEKINYDYDNINKQIIEKYNLQGEKYKKQLTAFIESF